MSNLSTEQRYFDTNEEVTAYVQEKMDLYRRKGVRDDSLWKRWVEDFEDWDVILFSKTDSEVRREFRDFLISRGIYMTPIPKGKHIDQQLAAEVKREEYHEWTSEELIYYKKKNPFGVSTRCDPDDPNYVDEESILAAAAAYRAKVHNFRGKKDEETNDKNGGGKGKEKEMITQISGQSQSYHADLYDENSISKKNTKTLLSQNATDLQPYPPRSQTQWEDRPLHKSRQVESLVRMYKEEDKYRDGTDSFDHKRRIFLNNCNNACVEKKYLKDALTNMFAGDSSKKYLDLTINREELTFDERCDLMKARYETVHWVNRRETNWNTQNLIEGIRKCSDKLQAFNNLERELRRVQRGLESHAGDAALRTRIINACYGVEDLHFVLFSPAKTTEGVCADKRARFLQLSLSGILKFLVCILCIHFGASIKGGQFASRGLKSA